MNTDGKQQSLVEIEEELGGVVTEEERSTKVAPPSFGLPSDLEDMAPRGSDEFDASAEEISRSMGVLDLSAPAPLEALEFNPSTLSNQGAAFAASSVLLAAPTEFAAPKLPSYLRTARTSFRSPKPLPMLLKDLAACFANLGVRTEGEGEDEEEAISGKRTVFECTVLRLMSVVEFECRVFSDPAGARGKHLVELRHMSGCRYAFAEAAQDVAGFLKVAFVGVKRCGAAAISARPPPLSADALLEMPSLRRATSAEEAATAAAALPPPPQCLEGGDDDDEVVCTAAHVASLLAPGAGPASQADGCRACGYLAAELASCMASCPAKGACGADHHGHHRLFAAGGAWVGLAARVAALAGSEAGSEAVAAGGDFEQLRAVAMAAVANVAALEHVCGDWLRADALPAVRGAVVEASGGGSAGSALGGMRQAEALRAAVSLAGREPAAFARALESDKAFASALEEAAPTSGHAQGGLGACSA